MTVIPNHHHHHAVKKHRLSTPTTTTSNLFKQYNADEYQSSSTTGIY
jgi:hypothetical protein